MNCTKNIDENTIIYTLDRVKTVLPLSGEVTLIFPAEIIDFCTSCTHF